MQIDKLYDKRFTDVDLAAKNNIWKILCKNVFQKYIPSTSTVVDVGAGYCEFINNIIAERKIALDINPDVKKFAASNVEIINESCMDVKSLPAQSVDVVFMSNFLEHLLSKKDVFETVKEAKRILKKGGRLIILQPNIRFLYNVYWDFFDHHTPISDRSLVELINMLDMKLDVCYPKFMPYTTKSKLPRGTFFVWLYLKFPPVWKIIGKQTLVIASRV